MIKVMFLPLNFGNVTQDGWAIDAFREAGCELQLFDYFKEFSISSHLPTIRNKLIERAVAFKPDLLLLQIQHTNIIDSGTILEIKKRLPKLKICNYNIDVRNYVQETYKNIANIADYNLISSTGQLDMMRTALNKEVKFWQIGFDPKLYYPAASTPNQFEYDVVFIANNNMIENYPGQPERQAVCELLRKVFGNRFGLFGDGWSRDLRSNGSVPQKDVAKIYHKGFISLSVSHFNNIDHYFSDRLLMCLACGRPTVSLRFPKWESYFINNCDLVMANNINDIPGEIIKLLNNPPLAEQIGEQGAAKALAELTYSSRINELLEMVGLR